MPLRPSSFALPGLMPITPTKAGKAQYATPEGAVRVLLHEEENTSNPDPDISVIITDVGENKILLDKDQCLVFKERVEAKDHYYLIIDENKVDLPIGTLMIHALINETDYVKIPLIVRDLPFND